jgi:phosphorylase kinase alpha/beta subunit
LYAQSQLLAIIMRREGPSFCLPEGVTIKDKLEALLRHAGTLRYWSVVRFCSAILQKIVDSISPYITLILVNGKQITIGSFAGAEHVIDHPLTPKEIHALIYSTISDPYEAVLQQEIALYVGRLVSTTPQLFQGILKIRLGSVIEAMKLYLTFTGEPGTKIESLAPSQIRKLLFKVMTDNTIEIHQKRQIEGALCRVPREFFNKVWTILKRLPGGVMISGQLLKVAQLPNTKSYDFNFVLNVESLLGRIPYPQYRQINVELLMIIHLILQRNPELYFHENTAVDLDKVISRTVARYQEGRDAKMSLEAFYCEGSAKTASFLARTVLDTLLLHSSPECKVS